MCSDPVHRHVEPRLPNHCRDPVRQRAAKRTLVAAGNNVSTGSLKFNAQGTYFAAGMDDWLPGVAFAGDVSDVD